MLTYKYKTTVNIKSASFVVIMLLHKGLTHTFTNKASVAFWREFHFNAFISLTTDWWLHPKHIRGNSNPTLNIIKKYIHWNHSDFVKCQSRPVSLHNHNLFQWIFAFCINTCYDTENWHTVWWLVPSDCVPISHRLLFHYVEEQRCRCNIIQPSLSEISLPTLALLDETRLDCELQVNYQEELFVRYLVGQLGWGLGLYCICCSGVLLEAYFTVVMHFHSVGDLFFVFVFFY